MSTQTFLAAQISSPIFFLYFALATCRAVGLGNSRQASCACYSQSISRSTRQSSFRRVRACTCTLDEHRVVAIVLLPGMDGSGILFEDFVSQLRAKSIVVCYPADQPLDYSKLEEFVLAGLPSNEPYILLAESFSGPIAIGLAARQLPQLRALVLVCSFAKAPLTLPRLLQAFLTGLPFWRAPVSIAAQLLLGRFRSDRIEGKLKQAIRAVPSRVWMARMRAVLAVDSTSSLSRIRAPILYLRASEDRVLFSATSKVISNHVPSTKVVAVEGPHFLLQAKPGESAAAIRTFANEHGLAL